MIAPAMAISACLLAQAADSTVFGKGSSQQVSGRSPQAVDANSPSCGWLVELARHNGHLIGRSDARRASLRVIGILETATEIDPGCADAYFWLYDLYNRLGRVNPAHKALTQYVSLAPENDSARGLWFDLEMERRESAEIRNDFLQRELARDDLSPYYESRLRTWLARHHYENHEMAEAGEQVEAALRLNPINTAARELAYELFGETDPEIQRVEMALQLISINPAQVNVVWELAEFLDRLSMHKEAQEWYTRAIDMHRRAEAGKIPPQRWQKLAISYLCSRDYEAARQTADEALKSDPSFHAARLLRATAAKTLGEKDEARRDEQDVRKAYDRLYEDVARNGPPHIAAELAWYYCYDNPDKKRALRLAKRAMDDRVPSSIARLAHGYALSANGQIEDAIKQLSPLADSDQMAALELARCRLKQGKQAEAVKILKEGATIQRSGVTFDQIRNLLKKHNEAVEPAPSHPLITAALNRFHRDVFDYYRRTSGFLEFSIRFAGSEPPPVGPINVTMRLENVGPFPISFGEGFMARPLVAVSAGIDGREGEPIRFEHYLQVKINERPILIPGDAVEKTIAVNVGAMQDRLIAAIDRNVNIEISAIFDPVLDEGKLAAGLGSMAAPPIQIVRRGIDLSDGGLEALISAAASADIEKRAEAAEQIGAVLAALRRRDTDSGISPDRLRASLAALLNDTDWRVRARATRAAEWIILDDRTLMPAAAARVQDKSAIVRMLAVYLFASKQGEDFRKPLEHIARSDASLGVRTLARSFLPAPGNERVSTGGEID